MRVKASKPSAPLRGEIQVPGDKSITHRAVLFGALAHGVSNVETNVLGRDNFSTIRIMQQLGVRIESKLTKKMFELAKEEQIQNIEEISGDKCHITVYGAQGKFLPFDKELDCGNSGTTSRLLCGVLAGSSNRYTLTGDASLKSRPFKRVTDPLSQMGAKFSGDRLPLSIQGGSLRGISYHSPKSSAQVKSAILLAGLFSKEPVEVFEPAQSRDHTERMFTAMGVPVEEHAIDGAWRVRLSDDATKRTLQGISLTIPGDFSAAAFFMVAGSVIPESHILIRNVGVSKTRTGLLSVLLRMGADIELKNHRLQGGEEVADIEVRAKKLSAVKVTHEDVVLAIDEIPAFCIAAALAEGTSDIFGAEELRVKESDRLAMMAAVLRDFSIEPSEREDGMSIIGLNGRPLVKAQSQGSWRKSGDHRIAMNGAILDYISTGKFEIDDVHAVETSFPTYAQCFQGLIGE